MISPVWRIVFFGTPAFAVSALKALLEGPDEVVGVVTRPDRKKGRGQKVSVSPVKDLVSGSGGNQIPLFQPERMKEEGFQAALRRLQPDLFVVAAYGQILPKSLLEMPRHGAVNVHASLLPKYRGAAPIAWSILEGESVTGVTIMRMDEGMDTGDILSQRETPIQTDTSAETLHDRLASMGAPLLMETLDKLKKGEVFPVRQDPSKATYAPPLKKEDGRIDWKRSAEDIDRQVRALNPWPGAYSSLLGHLLKIFKGEVQEGGTGTQTGTVLWVGADFIEVAAGKGSFRIKEVQLEGKKRMAMREFLAGHAIAVGTCLQ